ncbi:ankyrin repeat protein [Medicago truncatula]|uniref:Ankyrin repeat protein n=2 Tax=cellular organisms TaxID=131567 RepID=A0A072TDC1_MEDTR|nr:ankyrin repeat protein [Medicago truncatula]
MDEALSFAAYFGNIEIVKHMVSLGASPRHNFCECLKSAAIKNTPENTATFSYLLSLGAKPTAAELRDYHRYVTTPLFWASGCGNLDIVKMCIEQGCDIAFENHDALGEAGKNDQVEVLEYFATEILPLEYLEEFGIYAGHPFRLGHQSRNWWEKNKDTIIQRRKTIALYDSIQSTCQEKTVSKPRLKI